MADRDRSPRRDRGGGRRGGGGGGGGGGGSGAKAPVERRVFLSNIPFEMKWQEVKDLFRDEVGEVDYVNMFNDESDKPRGCGILEFATTDLARKAVDKMNKFDLKGRKLVVKEDTDAQRDRYGRITKGGDHRRERDRGDRSSDRDRRDRDRDRDRDRGGSSSSGSGNTYGLSPQFLGSLDIDGPLHTRLFVANLAYDVGESKLKEVFRLAGRVCHAELNKDKDGKSRGHGVIEYSHPVEAVQAISMFNNQVLYGRKMMVRFDKTPGPTPEELEQLPTRLPEGLEGVGMGLGSNGNPLTNVAQNLPQIQNQNNQGQAGGALNVGALANLANNLGSLQELAALSRTMGMGVGNGGGPAGPPGHSNNMGNMGGGGNMGGNMGNMAGMGGGGHMGNMGGGGGGGGMGGSGMGGGVGGMGGSGMGGGGGMAGAGGGGGPGGGYGPGGPGGMGGGPGGPPGGLGSMGGSGLGGMGSSMPVGGGGGGGHSSSLSGHSGGGGGHGSSMGGGGSRGGIGGSGIGLDALRSGGGGGGMGPGGDHGPHSLSHGGGHGGGPGLAPPPPVHSDAIIVRNLPPSCSWQALREGFSHCGEIKYAEMKERGTGMVRFASERDAERAVSMMNKHNIGGQTIDVRLL